MAWQGAGTHELFLESPRHNASFGSCMSLAEVYAVLLLWTRRYRQLCDSGDVSPYPTVENVTSMNHTAVPMSGKAWMSVAFGLEA